MIFSFSFSFFGLHFAFLFAIASLSAFFTSAVNIMERECYIRCMDLSVGQLELLNYLYA
jgi:hypothetical protein